MSDRFFRSIWIAGPVALALLAAGLAALPASRSSQVPPVKPRSSPAPVRKPAARQLSSYTGLLTRKLFTPQVPPPVEKAILPSPRPSIPGPGGLPEVALEPMAVALGPLVPPASSPSPQRPAHLAAPPALRLVGAVSMDGKLFALLEDGGTGASGYYCAGDEVAGYRVKRVGQRFVELAGPQGSTIVQLSEATEGPSSG